AIECRRRVKLQLQKMDHTFEEVDFSYRVIGESTNKEVVSLEEIQYLGKENIFVESDAIESIVEESKKHNKSELAGKHVEIYDNQKGVSYKNLFGEYLVGVKEITIIDPYIRLPYQIRNLVELINLVASHKKADETIKVNLITDNDENFIEESKERLKELQDNLSTIGIDFYFQFDEMLHDRYILVDDQWKIILGRGLDIWNKTNGYFDIAETNQLYRSCKGFSMTVVSMC
ncbi:MAG TPA: MIT C-terminal domain-containing protein, partial [Dysgonamonadaceae bacterium]|nr:MIT C-terminal domain-containing protein [Dysgonamonadaceae bacterium]